MGVFMVQTAVLVLGGRGGAAILPEVHGRSHMFQNFLACHMTAHMTFKCRNPTLLLVNTGFCSGNAGINAVLH